MKLNTRFFIRYLFLLTLCMAGFFSLASAAQTNQLKGVRAWPSPDNTRVVLDLSSKPDYEINYLTHPDRVVIDLKSSISRVNLKKISNDGPLVKSLRESASDEKGTYRLVIDLNHASKAEIFTLPPEAPYGHRLVLDLPHQKSAGQAANVKPQVAQSADSVGRDIIIAIDAGHGGEDPGALGKYSYEKKINLQIAKRLEQRINQQKGMSAFLIRTGDYFVNLNQRSAIARKGKADFLVSIHADGFTSSQPNGASVWVLSNRRATTELGRWMEKHEAHSELLGGAGNLIQDSSSVPFLTEMFLDMSMGNTMDVGYSVGNLVVNELKRVTKLHKKMPVHASLAVLKSPDIPSILVEAGFITNRTEERLLNKPSHQNKIANAVFNGIYRHFTETPPQHTLFAQKKRAIRHTVRGGESLSILAARYSVTVKELQTYNNLTSNSLSIGQVIKVPANYRLVVNQDPVRRAVTAPQKSRIHKVASGESLSLIASRYGTTTDTLKAHNNLRSTVLAIGQKIKIPGDVEVSAPIADIVKLPSVHSVARGESLSLIASRYGTTTDILKEHNNLRSTVLAVGQKIKIPGDAEVSAPIADIVKLPSVHRVASGESLSLIASRYDTTTDILKEHNNLRSTVLAVGQQLNIPGDAVTSAPKEVVQPSRQASVHRVASGESLSVIASRYGITTATLKEHNNLRSTRLAVGQKLNIPGDAAAESNANIRVAKLPSVHRVASGESLSVIASRYGIATDLLKKHNNLRSTRLTVGQKLNIPTAEEQLTKHQVRSGESLSVIADRYGTTTNALKSFNKLSSNSLIIGQVLTIPVT